MNQIQIQKPQNNLVNKASFHSFNNDEEKQNKQSPILLQKFESASLQSYNSKKNRKKKHSQQHNHDDNYDYLKIPPNWDLAKLHAKSRETKPEIGDENQIQDICQCCGYEINRKPINLWVNLIDIGFLGPGFPLFYNYLKNCVVMLTFLFLIQGIPNIIIHSQGTFCHSSSLKAFKHSEQQKEHPKKKFIEYCVENSVVKYSLANIINQQGHESFAIWSLLAMIVQLILTVYFRKQQKDMDNVVDEENVTPADYSVFVANIPKDLPNTKKEIQKIFEEESVQGKKVQVTKVVLVYDIKEILLLEEEIDEKIKDKQNILNDNFDLKNPKVLEIDVEIHYLHSQLHNLQHNIENDSNKFTGQAIICFQTEQFNYFKGGASEKYQDSLYVKDRHLYIQQAPEPAEIDWEYIHSTTKEKIIARTIANLATLLLTIFTFSVIALLSYLQSLMIDHAYEKLFEQQLHNKDKKIVDREKWSTKTSLNISFAIKLTLSLFTNTALITFFVEIIFFKNYYGIGGGMILGEYLVFINNAIIPGLAWIIDPWSIAKNYQRNKELAKGDKSTLTQKQANILMEHPDYAMGKRYADVMKTMWFTFFYSPAIPMATLWSILGIIIYYFADKYNLIYRRTVKENIGKGLTFEMIEMIEYCILLHCVFQNILFKLIISFIFIQFFKKSLEIFFLNINYFNTLTFIISLCLLLLQLFQCYLCKILMISYLKIKVNRKLIIMMMFKCFLIRTMIEKILLQNKKPQKKYQHKEVLIYIKIYINIYIIIYIYILYLYLYIYLLIQIFNISYYQIRI
ncbi:hypothetical protein IMG5_070910 [Ichthyophthirius multifiliis]|uniref:CSC1/OSCA1-like cytosolic domain-containing protein n=1 Tax=Ichthyophthirius multifiliis TaxID=5932 RepID=G0QPT5_ICHMU|nr:hypothetical protein IMG5_070910 [Ichthyophthirius multifiliis]EGR32765.1 hypothetical protein IMG5_070910 [Ichthyophthirius multifiliis]|eukprot:XP_004036751.1 hypothetical protein IMG5_070910 [Ichthyophthirius multifiliis]